MDMDPNFLDEVIADKDVYFLDNMEKIRVLTKSKSDKNLGPKAQNVFFKKSIVWGLVARSAGLLCVGM